MPMQRNKGVLEGNIFSAGNQTLTIIGIPSPLLVLQRDAIAMEMGMIELADKRRVPGARNNSGEFNAVIQLAHDETREVMQRWYRGCLDEGNGISPDYKRDGVLTYRRHFRGTPGSEYAGAGRQGEDFQLRIIGLWVMRLEYPEFDMAGGDEGDADAKLTCQFCYDDTEPVDAAFRSSIAGLTDFRK